MKKIISIIGSDSDDEHLSDYALKVAQEVGRLAAQHGFVLSCGGRGGIMEAACKGAKEEHGLTIGILPFTKDEANDYIDIAIPTTIGNFRNFLVANSGDVIIAIGGRWGTLNEISISMIYKKSLILIKGTGGCVDEIINGCIMQNIESDYFVVDSAEEAIKKVIEILGK
ncbi:MAG: TIGR00725 family protein [Euryarchaeota archaeon RBG_13_31_8]|nr:MAG: TIGR00725 family protein [Euryarchaeota archaeon RBG_13_31_8]